MAQTPWKKSRKKAACDSPHLSYSWDQATAGIPSPGALWAMHITHARLQGSHKTRAQAPRSMPWWRKPSWSTLQTHRRAGWWVGGADIPAAAIRKHGRKLRGCKRAQLRSPSGCGMGLSPRGSSRWSRTSRGWARRPPEVPSSLISSVIPWFGITRGCSRKPSWAPCPNILALTALEAQLSEPW